jgi:hypothetical protein
MSLRLEKLEMKSAATHAIGAAPDLATADQQLVQHINNLQEQLLAAQRQNNRLKGAR